MSDYRSDKFDTKYIQKFIVMKFSLIVLAVASFALSQVLAAPSSEPLSEAVETIKESQDGTSSMPVEVEESGRTKKSASPKSICTEQKDLQGTSYLQCTELQDTEGAGSIQASAYASAPSSYGSSQSYSAPASPSYAPSSYKVNSK